MDRFLITVPYTKAIPSFRVKNNFAGRVESAKLMRYRSSRGIKMTRSRPGLSTRVRAFKAMATKTMPRTPMVDNAGKRGAILSLNSCMVYIARDDFPESLPAVRG
jgi:hypothetical protein